MVANTNTQMIEVRQEKEAIAVIIQRLGGLPLALEHAGSYIFREQCTFQMYLKELEANISFHLSKDWKQGQESVFASWEMSLEVIRQRTPKAADLLSICGFLDHDDISEEFLRRGMGLENNGRYSFSIPPCTAFFHFYIPYPFPCSPLVIHFNDKFARY